MLLTNIGEDKGLFCAAAPRPFTASMGAVARGRGIVCPGPCGGEAAWAGSSADGHEVLAPDSLIALINHFKGAQLLSRPQPRLAENGAAYPDLRDIKGQETAKRALEVAASGGHNILTL